MIKCLRITIPVSPPHNPELISSVVQKQAHQWGIEGVSQKTATGIVIIACGQIDPLEEFLDQLYAESVRHEWGELIIEPILRDRDYRGVFRLLE